jgi:hypothetical protein
MTVLVACETVLLALMVVLVAGLLRSHAEILRRLGPPSELPEPPSRPHGPSRVGDLVGTTLEGDAVKLSLGPAAPPTLIAFLTSGCSVCLNFWHGPPSDVIERDLRLVVVTKDTSHESPSRLAELRPPDVPVLMSSAAWEEHEVPAAPYFVFVSEGVVRGEGSATSWKQIASLLRDAEHDARHANGDERTDRIDEILEASGIGPGHPSLYPADDEDPRA